MVFPLAAFLLPRLAEEGPEALLPLHLEEEARASEPEALVSVQEQVQALEQVLEQDLEQALEQVLESAPERARD